MSEMGKIAAELTAGATTRTAEVGRIRRGGFAVSYG
jgi:hypothetical protein